MHVLTKEGDEVAKSVIITSQMIEEKTTAQIIDLLSQKEQTLIEGELVDHESGLLLSIINCESPIERLLAIGMYSQGLGLISNFYPQIKNIDIFPQYTVEIGSVKYRLDFVVPVRCKGKEYLFAVECDGHNFHEKTKEQSRRDKQRERKLIAAGYTVIRFTGSEIYTNPYKCAKELIQIIVKTCLGER